MKLFSKDVGRYGRMKFSFDEKKFYTLFPATLSMIYYGTHSNLEQFLTPRKTLWVQNSFFLTRRYQTTKTKSEKKYGILKSKTAGANLNIRTCVVCVDV